MLCETTNAVGGRVARPFRARRERLHHRKLAHGKDVGRRLVIGDRADSGSRRQRSKDRSISRGARLGCCVFDRRLQQRPGLRYMSTPHN